MTNPVPALIDSTAPQRADLAHGGRSSRASSDESPRFNRTLQTADEGNWRGRPRQNTDANARQPIENGGSVDASEQDDAPVAAGHDRLWPGIGNEDLDPELREAIAELIDAGVIDPETGELKLGDEAAEDLDPELLAALQWLGLTHTAAQNPRDGAQEPPADDADRKGKHRHDGAVRIVSPSGGEKNTGKQMPAPAEQQSDRSEAGKPDGASAHAKVRNQQSSGQSESDPRTDGQLQSETRAGNPEASMAGGEAAQRSARQQQAVPDRMDRGADASPESPRPAQTTDHRVMSAWFNAAASDAPAKTRAAQVEQWVTLMNRSGEPGGRPTVWSGVMAGALNSTMNGAAITGTAVTSSSGEGHTPLPTASSSTLLESATRFSGQVMRGMTAVMHQQGGSMTMRLDPPELGQLRIQMTVSRGVVTASFQPTTAQAQQLIEQNMSTLRTSLEQHGMTVERISVLQAPASTHAHDMRDESGQQRQQHDSGEGRSRGRQDGESRRDENGQSTSRRHQFEQAFQDTAGRFDDDEDGREHGGAS